MLDDPARDSVQSKNKTEALESRLKQRHFYEEETRLYILSLQQKTVFFDSKDRLCCFKHVCSLMRELGIRYVHGNNAW